MNPQEQVRHLELGRHDLLEIDGTGHQRIICESGELWLTFAGDARDLILRPGESWTRDRPGMVVISAFVAARLRMEGEASRAGRRQPGAWLDHLRRWKAMPLAAYPDPRAY